MCQYDMGKGRTVCDPKVGFAVERKFLRVLHSVGKTLKNYLKMTFHGLTSCNFAQWKLTDELKFFAPAPFICVREDFNPEGLRHILEITWESEYTFSVNYD